MKRIKTNAMRILDRENIEYEQNIYDSGDDVDGISVARKLGQDKKFVYKTLVTTDNKGDYFVFVIPVACELDLKKAAKAVGVKKIDMLHMKDLKKVTGYIRGGCSPIGMIKQFVTVVDSSCDKLENFYVSGGMIGVQIKIRPKDLCKVVNAAVIDVKK